MAPFEKHGKGVCALLLGLCIAWLAAAPALADSLLLPGFSTHQVDEKPAAEEPAKTTFIPVENQLVIGVGAGFTNGPYIGQKTDWTVLPVVSYEGTYAYIRGLTAGLKFINEPYVEASVFVGWDDTGVDSKDTEHLIKSRHASAVVGLEARVYTPIGLFSASASGDVSGHSNGFTGSVSYTYSLGLGDLSLDASAGVSWSTSNYNDYYYGLDGKESERTELHTYDAGAGAAPFIGLTAVYPITEHWGVFCDAQYIWLERSVRHSPLVDRKDTYTVLSGVFYAF